MSMKSGEWPLCFVRQLRQLVGKRALTGAEKVHHLQVANDPELVGATI
jgi:hypothetical protein